MPQAKNEVNPDWFLVPLMIFNWGHLGCILLAPLGCAVWAVLVVMIVVMTPYVQGGLALAQPLLTSFAARPEVVLALIALSAFVAGRLARKLGQPQVVGEILVGIAAGPSLLGWIALPDYDGAGVASTTRAFLFELGHLGIILYLLLAGLRLDVGSLRSKARAATLISSGALAVPLLIGTLLGSVLYPTYGTTTVSPLLFSLYLGAAMAVSALPVLVRILDEHGLLGTPFGTLSVACATVDDLLAWLIFGAIAAAASVGSSGQASLGLIGLLILGGVLAFAWPIWRRLGADRLIGEGSFDGAMPVLLAWGLLVAGLSQTFGLNGGVGAFYAGVLLPLDRSKREALSRTIEPLVSALLVPAFFVYAGALTSFQSVDRPEMWLIGLGLVVVAVVSKGGAAYVLGRLGGLEHRNAGGVAMLLNARGVMGLIILTSGLEAGLISPPLFTLMVLMVLITNVLVNPALAWFRPSSDLRSGYQQTAVD